MPECVEVEKLIRQIEPAFRGRRIKSFQRGPEHYDPRKFATQGWEAFKAKVLGKKFGLTERIGKNIWIREYNDEGGWHIHLNSTGWLLPGNAFAHHCAKIDPIAYKFLHSLTEKSLKVLINLDDGQEWHYHDSRTWSKWTWRDSRSVKEDPYFSTYGPDWMREPDQVAKALVELRTKRTVKDVLTDQHLTAGVGNYLACEGCFAAGIHPLTPFDLLSTPERYRLVHQLSIFIDLSMEMSDHLHWNVFDRKGLACTTCRGEIDYVKDSPSAQRGSYFCPKCQPLKTRA